MMTLVTETVTLTVGLLATWKAQATIQAASVNTGNEKRDGHLRSPDFFAAEEFPTLSFVSTGVEKQGETYLLKGDLTMRGVTKPIVLTLEYYGSIKDPWGNDRAGFSAKGMVNRKDFGLSWNNLLETGGAVVSDEIAIELIAKSHSRDVKSQPAISAVEVVQETTSAGNDL